MSKLIELRGYQKTAIQKVREEWKKNNRRTILSLPTGTGKTWIFVFVVYMVRANGLRCLILVNRDELVSQTVEKLAKVGVQCGICKGQKNEIHRDVVVASIQTISRSDRLYNLAPNHFSVVVTDECHYANSLSYQKVLWYFEDAWHLGVTATPFRGDKKSLRAAGWDSMAYYYSIEEAIKDGWLCPVRFVRVNTDVKLDTVKKGQRMGESDFVAKQLEKAVNTPQRNAKIVSAALKVMPGRKTLAFCAGVRHAIDLANAFRRVGIDARAVYGSMKIKYRRSLIKQHRQGAFPILTNCDLLTTGYDDETIQAIIMARPTKSKVLYLQELGRGLRVSPGKSEVIVLDVVDVASKHQMAIGQELVTLTREMSEGRRPRALPKPDSAEGGSGVEEVPLDSTAPGAEQDAGQLSSGGEVLDGDLVSAPPGT